MSQVANVLVLVLVTWKLPFSYLPKWRPSAGAGEILVKSNKTLICEKEKKIHEVKKSVFRSWILL